mgnify:CR=1 FL=1
METVATELLNIVNRTEPRLRQIAAEDAALKPALHKWSKKEILGHLIDSASNNHQKFVRMMVAQQPVDFVGYDQDDWVAVQQYNRQKWEDIIALWGSYNHQIAQLIRLVDPSKLDNMIRISGNGPYTLAFVMTDYIEHLKHHLLQIIPDSGLTSSFSMAPYV